MASLLARRFATRATLTRSVAIISRSSAFRSSPRSMTGTGHSRRGLASTAEQPRLRLGSIAPNFQAQTSQGDIDFHQFIGDKWTILFSHPADFTPVCTTELGAFARLGEEFEKRGVKMIGLSANDLTSHKDWIRDIDELSETSLTFPIIADANRRVAWLYDMVDQSDIDALNAANAPSQSSDPKPVKPATALPIRSVFVIDPKKQIRLTMTYPASTGRNTAEVLRVIDALQQADRQGIATPVNWTVGQDVIVPLSVSSAEAVKRGFEGFREVKPYLRYRSG